MLRHQPVLVTEIFTHLPKQFSRYFDGTFGHGGHAEYILTHLPKVKNLTVIACDLDEAMMKKGLAFTQQRKKQITPLLNTYANINQIGTMFGPFDFMLLDLGVNMEHFKDGARGFSINVDAPLDMRFSQGNPLTAQTILQTYSSEQLEKMLMKYGDFSPKSATYFAKEMVEARSRIPLKTTGQLKTLLHTLHCNQKKIAVIFQALRIETNKELEQLELFLNDFSKQLTVGGRCGIITYHSIEDRIVKIAFKKLADRSSFQLVNKKVIQPHYTEIQHNKASRSAKLRILERIN